MSRSSSRRHRPRAPLLTARDGRDGGAWREMGPHLPEDSTEVPSHLHAQCHVGSHLPAPSTFGPSIGRAVIAMLSPSTSTLSRGTSATLLR
jgi:hypothetical protein